MGRTIGEFQVRTYAGLYWPLPLPMVPLPNATCSQRGARNGAFDEEVTRLVGEAFDAACALLGNIAYPAREIVADRIIDEATSGERDLIRLRDAGIAALRRR